MGLIDLVRPLQGTDSRREFSTGNTLPLVGVPRGLTYFTAQTGESGFAFDRQGAKLSGIRVTHMPSPWMNDFGHFDIFPTVGTMGPTPDARASGYFPERATFAPNYFEADLLRYWTKVRVSATRACAVMEFVYPPDAGDRAAIVLQSGDGPHGTSEFRVDTAGGKIRISGRAGVNHAGVAGDFANHFVIDVENAEAVGTGTLDGHRGVSEGPAVANGPRSGVFVWLRPKGTVVLRVGTSFISQEQARANLAREVGGMSLEDVKAAAAKLWEAWLGRIQADGGSDAERQCLYSAMYRVGLFPMAMHEFDENDRAIHYSPYDGKTHTGVLYTNNGFWDTYRTVYPLLGLIDREGFGEIIEGFLQAYRQGGWLPRWASPGYRDCMIGSHGDVMIAEAINRGIEGFDYKEAYEAIRRNAFEQPDRPGVYGRASLNDYHRLGYTPDEGGKYAVSWTLDNAHCDWCIATVAKKLGRNDDYDVLMKRSQNYRNVWHAESRFMRPKKLDGSWAEPWSEFGWGGCYVEGGPWQHSLHVPHDPKGLAELHGGVDKLIERIDEMLVRPARFETGHYGGEIHEMTEMAKAVDSGGATFGQYAQSNQPVHAFLWLPAQLGHADVTAKHVRRVMQNLYTPTHLPGDEDNGEMSAWYILGAMNRYPACAGSGEMVEAPVNVFDRVRVTV